MRGVAGLLRPPSVRKVSRTSTQNKRFSLEYSAAANAISALSASGSSITCLKSRPLRSLSLTVVWIVATLRLRASGSRSTAAIAGSLEPPQPIVGFVKWERADDKEAREAAAVGTTEDLTESV